MALPAVLIGLGKKAAMNAAKNTAVSVAMNSVGPKNDDPEDEKKGLKIFVAFALVFIIVGGIALESMARGVLTVITPSTLAHGDICVLFPDSMGEEPHEDLNPDAEIKVVTYTATDVDLDEVPIYQGSYYFPMTDGSYRLGKKYDPEHETSPHIGLELISLSSASPVIAIAGGLITDKSSATTAGDNINNAISLLTRTSESQYVTIVYRGLLSPSHKPRGTVINSSVRIEDTGPNATDDQYSVVIEVHNGDVGLSGDASTSLDPEKWLKDQNAEIVGTPTASEALDSGLLYGDDWLNADSTTVCRVNNGGGAVTGDYPSGGVSNGGWGGHKNGQIPISELASPTSAPGSLMRADAAVAFDNLNEAFRAHFGYYISVTSSYRDYEGQLRAKARHGHMAAKPGTSNHGWGLALDLGSGIASRHTAQSAWMRENAHKYGWINPKWAQPGGTKLEPWHWEFVGNG